MFKKFFSVMLLAAVLIFVGGQNNSAQAQDVYVGTSNTTGWACYLMTETIRGDYNQHRSVAQATLKMVTQSNNVKYLDYTFRKLGRYTWSFRTSQGYEGEVDPYVTPIEYKSLNVAKNYLGW